MPPLSVMVKPVSGACNMRCTYCFYNDEMAHRQTAAYAPMDSVTAEALIRRAFIYADGSVSFAFQGGEPTLAGADFYRLWLQLERKYNTRGIHVQHAIQTNGLSLDEALLNILCDGGFLAGVSVDGTQAIHDARRLDPKGQGTYQQVQQTLASFRRRGLEYNILCVVDQKIAAQPKAVYEALKPHGYLQFIPCMDGLDGTFSPDSLTSQAYGAFLCQIFNEYEQDYRSNRMVSVRLFDNWIAMLKGYPPEACNLRGRCSSNFLIESNGNAYPCDFYGLDEWLLGNITKSSFFRLESSSKKKLFYETSMYTDSACKECEWLPLCRGGCRREREPLVSGLPRRFRLCEGHKMFFESCYDRLAALAKLEPPTPPKNRCKEQAYRALADAL